MMRQRWPPMVKRRDLTRFPVAMPLVREYSWIVRKWCPLAVSATMADLDGLALEEDISVGIWSLELS